MRSASVCSRLAVLALVAGAAGCSTVGGVVDAVHAGNRGRRTASARRGARRARRRRSTTRRSTPATQRAFDDASRALRSGRADDAERAFQALAQANPELGGPHANLGVIYRQAGKLAEAVGELEQAVKLSPRQPIYLNQLGIAYRQQGQFAKARDAYERAIALDPGYAAAVLNLGILNDLYLGDTPRALELYDRYLALTPERRRDRHQVGRRSQEPQARADHGQSSGEAMNLVRIVLTGVVAGAAAWAVAAGVGADAEGAGEGGRRAGAVAKPDQPTSTAPRSSATASCPRSLYIVPWKKPGAGDLSGRPLVSVLDEALAPVDRDVFRRQVRYDAQAVRAGAGARRAAPRAK